MKLKFVVYIFTAFIYILLQFWYLIVNTLLLRIYLLVLVITHEVTQSLYKFKHIDYHSSKEHLSSLNIVSMFVHNFNFEGSYRKLSKHKIQYEYRYFVFVQIGYFNNIVCIIILSFIKKKKKSMMRQNKTID